MQWVLINTPFSRLVLPAAQMPGGKSTFVMLSQCHHHVTLTSSNLLPYQCCGQFWQRFPWKGYPGSEQAALRSNSPRPSLVHSHTCCQSIVAPHLRKHTRKKQKKWARRGSEVITVKSEQVLISVVKNNCWPSHHLNVLQPCCNVLKWLLTCDVIYQNDTLPGVVRKNLTRSNTTHDIFDSTCYSCHMTACRLTMPHPMSHDLMTTPSLVTWLYLP